jgi:hypothetical protein
MKYLLLICAAESDYAKMTPDQSTANMEAYRVFTEDIAQSKVMVSGEALQPIATAKTVRLRDGKVVTTDGPFAETKEQVAGYYVVDCKTIDEAVAIAARIPDAKIGSIEVRPVMEM